MGRMITGDIESKLWFGIQPSDDADFFGVEGTQPNYLEYCFDKENLSDIDKGIKKCIKALGKYNKLMDKFFKENDGYNDDMITKYLKVNREKARYLLKWYARLKLGLEIQKCVKDKGECIFEAEC